MNLVQTICKARLKLLGNSLGTRVLVPAVANGACEEEVPSLTATLALREGWIIATKEMTATAEGVLNETIFLIRVWRG